MAWNRTKPGAGDNLESSPVRANFQAIDGALLGQNLLSDPEQLIWPGGSDTGVNAVPGYYEKVGSPAVSLVTGGKRTKFSAKFTYSGSGTDGYKQTLIETHDGSLDGAIVSVAVWVKTDSSGCTVYIDDGGTGGKTSSSAHSGGNDWELLTLTHTITADSTKLEWGMEITATGSAEINQPTVVMGEIPPSDTIPGQWQEGTIVWKRPGAINSVGNFTSPRFQAERPYFLRKVNVSLEKTAVTDTGTRIECMIEKWGGAEGTTSPGFTEIFSSGPTILQGAGADDKVPDATSTLDSTAGGDHAIWSRSYDRWIPSTAPVAGKEAYVNNIANAVVKQADTSTSPADSLVIYGRTAQPIRPLASYLPLEL